MHGRKPAVATTAYFNCGFFAHPFINQHVNINAKEQLPQSNKIEINYNIGNKI